MPHTFITQRTQISGSELYDDGLTPGIGLVTASFTLESDLNSLRTQVRHVIWGHSSGSWFDAIPGRATVALDKDLTAVETVLSGALQTVNHATLRQFIHLADNDGPMDGFTSGAFEETLPVGSAFPTSKIWWTDNGKTLKIVEEIVAFNGDKTVATDVWKMYATDGVTVILTMTDTFDYTAGKFMTPTRTRTLV